MPSESNSTFDPTLERARELNCEGFGWGHAFGKAWLEHRISNLDWPAKWGDDLRVLIYGDFEAPTKDLSFPQLGITVHHEKLENTVIRSALCVVEATVEISERSVPAILDAVRRINVLLGSWTLVAWGNSGCGWWSYITHDSDGGVQERFDHHDLTSAVQGVLRLPSTVRQKVDAALYWVREPRALIMEHHRSDLLRIYAAYWNAFECLVEAVLILQPQAKLSKTEKQTLIDEFLAERNGKLSSSDIATCYQEIVNPGFVGKASHALGVCFADLAPEYINECFRLPDRPNRLYDIRNAINHGDIDAENPEERLRVDARLSKLWMIIWGMFGRLVPFPTPVERPPDADKAE
ncbi:MAG: hypothetical protein ACI92S_001154 [Planctomycetaceae bacterium]|jgi:hypothetical protein